MNSVDQWPNQMAISTQPVNTIFKTNLSSSMDMCDFFFLSSSTILLYLHSFCLFLFHNLLPSLIFLPPSYYLLLSFSRLTWQLILFCTCAGLIVRRKDLFWYRQIDMDQSIDLIYLSVRWLDLDFKDCRWRDLWICNVCFLLGWMGFCAWVWLGICTVHATCHCRGCVAVASYPHWLGSSLNRSCLIWFLDYPWHNAAAQERHIHQSLLSCFFLLKLATPILWPHICCGVVADHYK